MSQNRHFLIGEVEQIVLLLLPSQVKCQKWGHQHFGTFHIFIFHIDVSNVELCNILPLLNIFSQANDHCISTSWKWFNIEVYSRSTWFYFELNLSYFFGFLWKKNPVKKGSHKLFWRTIKALNIFKNIPEKKL